MHNPSKAILHSRAIHPNETNRPHAIYPNETVGAAPVCPPERPRSGVSIPKTYGGLTMDAPLQGDTGGHTGTAPTISRMAPCSKVAGEQFADGLNREKVAGE